MSAGGWVVAGAAVVYVGMVVGFAWAWAGRVAREREAERRELERLGRLSGWGGDGQGEESLGTVVKVGSEWYVSPVSRHSEPGEGEERAGDGEITKEKIMTNEEKLLPCPFCGGEKLRPAPTIGFPVSVMCKTCRAEGKPCLTAEEATVAWNVRWKMEKKEAKLRALAEQWRSCMADNLRGCQLLDILDEKEGA